MLHAIRSSLQWKLIILMTSVITLVVTTIGAFNYYQSAQAIDEDVRRFSNQIPYFTQLFKKHYGLSPIDYKRRMKS